MLSSLTVTAVLVISFLSVHPPQDASLSAPVPSRVMAVGDPIALIEPLPEEVSNGTWCYLDGQNSSSNGGTIKEYTWDILYNGVHTKYFEPLKHFIFRQLGLYVITLTITTSNNKTGIAYTAVYSVPDSDSDLMPDWWEVMYFGNLSEAADTDFDGDGYTNLQEYASGTNPTVKDPPWYVKNWYYIAAIAGVIAVAFVIAYPRLKKRRKAEVKEQIKAAIEIEKALEEDK